MAKLWPVLVIAAAAIAAAVLMFGGEDDGGAIDEDEPVAYDEQGNPILLTSDAPRRPKREPAPPPVKPEDRDKPDPLHHDFITGRVIDAETKKPIAGARVWAESVQKICPRLPGAHQAFTTQTDGDGNFGLRKQVAREWLRADVFAHAKGYVVEVRCGVAKDSKITLLLRRALQQKVHVTDLHGRPITSATVQALPAEGTPSLPGHAAAAVTDRSGDAEIDGLIPGALMLSVDHPAYMPQQLGPFDPKDGDEIAVKLAPALRIRLVIRSDDASAIKNPTLAWATNGTPPHRGLELLEVQAAGPESEPLSEVRTLPVRIPCDHREVRLEVKADGFEPWIPQPEPLPMEGGERELIASLRRDPTLGSLTIKYEDADGEPVNYAEMQPVPEIMRLDQQAISSGIVLETTETLRFPAIPAGPYRITVRSPGHAPGVVDVTVRAREKNEAVCKLEPPAKLKLQFVSPERTLVRFRLLKEGRVIPAFPEDAPRTPGEAGAPPLVVQGNEGTVFTGLPPGPLIIQVTSEELAAPQKSVTLRAGEVTEMEIQVRRK